MIRFVKVGIAGMTAFPTTPGGFPWQIERTESGRDGFGHVGCARLGSGASRRGRRCDSFLEAFSEAFLEVCHFDEDPNVSDATPWSRTENEWRD